jgi:myo-inositol-1(or 4)-monophosphatase
MPADPSPLSVAEAAARAAGAILRDGQRRPKEVVAKGRTDIVTWADGAAQAAIVDVIHAAYPGDRIVGEEGTLGDESAERTWIVDPLDGTSNYAHGIPFFCVSVAVKATGGPLLAGVVYDPLRDECFAAEAGGPSALAVSTTASLDHAIITTGLQNDDPDAIDRYSVRLANLYRACRGVRLLGSPALTMSYVAAGRVDGMVQRDALFAWDVAAGAVLVEAAGGRVTGFEGEPVVFEGRVDVVISNGLLHDELLAVSH